MYRKYVKEVYDDYIVAIDGWKHYYKDNYLYKSINKYGSIYYYNETGNRHRIDGPAYEGADGYKEYWIEGVRYSYKGWLEKVKEYA